MAIVWAFRIGVMIAPSVVRWAATGGSPPTQGATLWVEQNWRRFIDAAVDGATLSAEWQATQPEGSYVAVTEFSGSFEMRKLQVRFQRTPPGGVIEDIDVNTMHFLKAPGGTPTNSWLDSDYTTLEGLLDTCYGQIKSSWASTLQVGQYRWYASGPDWDVTPAPYNPARRITERNIAGTSGSAALPPQVAASVTLKTSARPTWGRFYLPAFTTGSMAAEGIISSTTVTNLASWWVTMFNGARAADLLPVVFTRARGEYTRKDGTVLPAKAASCHTVDFVQVDNIFDVIRSRRWGTTTQRVTTALT